MVRALWRNKLRVDEYMAVYKRQKISSKGYSLSLDLSSHYDGQPTEADILKSCKHYLDVLERQRPFFWRRMAGQGKIIHGSGGKQIMIKSDTKGFPDLFVMKDNIAFAIELKRRYGSYLSVSQASTLASFTVAGGIGAIVTSVNGLRNLLDDCPASRTIETNDGIIPIFD